MILILLVRFSCIVRTVRHFGRRPEVAGLVKALGGVMQ